MNDRSGGLLLRSIHPSSLNSPLSPAAFMLFHDLLEFCRSTTFSISIAVVRRMLILPTITRRRFQFLTVR